MCDTVRGDVGLSNSDSAEKFESTNIEEEITTMKTEVIEEFYDYGMLGGVGSDDVKPFSTSEYFQSVMDECPAVSPYEQILKNDCYEQRIVWCKEENDFGMSEENVAVKVEKKYACDKCNYVTKSRPNFLKHTIIHSRKQFKCETCGRLFKRKEMLEKHGKVQCKTRRYICDICSYVTMSRPHFRRHTLVHSGKKQFKCDTCGSSFRQKHDLKKHVEIHNNERRKEVSCPYCNNNYYTNVSLQRHINIKHACKKYKCELCDYTAGYKHFLKRHELIKHGNGDKLYKCKYCEHSTHYRTNLENHERTHSNATLLKCTYKNCKCEQQRVSNKEKSCDCDPCQFETAYRSSLGNHILVKHSVKAERHACTVCTYSTHFQRYLRDHMRVHSNKETPKKFKCEHCDHTTHRKWNLDQHTLIHTNMKIFKCTYINCKCARRRDCVGEKPCDCETCNYQTVHRSALKRHVLTKHSGEAKKHTCTYCDYSTHVKADLERHLLRKHSNAKSVPVENS